MAMREKFRPEIQEASITCIIGYIAHGTNSCKLN